MIRSARLLAFILVALSPLLLAPPARAQDTTETPPAESPQADARLATPEETMFTFLGAMDTYSKDRSPESLNEALTCFDFAGVKDRALQREFAILMLRVLDRIKHVERSDFFNFFIDPSARQFVYFPQDRLPEHRTVKRLTSGKIVFAANDAGEWRFSEQTVAGLNALFRDIESLPESFGEGGVPLTLSMLIRSKVPESLRKAPFLDIEYWQWIGLLAVIFAGIILDFIVRLVLRGIWARIETRRGVDRDHTLIKKAVRPFGLLAAGALWYGSLHLLGLPANALMVLLIAVRVILMLAGVLAAFRVVDLAAAWVEGKAAQTRTKLDDLLVPLIRKTLKTFIAAFGLIYIAQSFDIQILPLLTGLGIGGLAFAFAAKDTIENFFGSVAVILDQPFEVGDWIVIDGVEGTVEQLGLRSTRIRTFYNSVVTVPNATLVRATVDNYGRRRFRRFKTHIALTYDTRPEKIEAFCEGVREIIRLHPYTRKDYFHVWLNKFGDCSLDVLVYMFHECPDWGTELRERHRFMLDVLRLGERLGVSFAFPTQTIEFKNLDLAEPGGPASDPARESEMNARRAGLEAARGLTSKQPWREVKPGPVLYSGSGLDKGPAEDVEG
ncbi:MAG: mechanosensitive ion channel family protein [Phycisphaeraceae bacterium]|nr:MAG: mechanosensitive ion channel family protein [Phycisphaeraceae bacterium]